MGSRAKRPRPRRWLRVALGVAIATGIALATGLPQPWLIKAAGRMLFGAGLTVENPTLWGALQIARLEVYDPDSARGDPAPAAVARGLVVDYSIFPFGGSFIQNIEAESLDLHIDASAGTSNIDFFRRLTTGDGNRLTTPRQVTIRSVSVAFNADALSADLDGLHLFSVAEDSEKLVVEIRSEQPPGSIRLAGPGETIEIPVADVAYHSLAEKRNLFTSFKVALDETQSLEYTFKRTGDTPPTNRISLAQWDPAPWLEFFGIAGLSLNPIHGTADIVRNDDEPEYAVSADVSLSSLTWREFQFDTVDVAGALTVPDTFHRIAVESIRADADDYLSYLALNGAVDLRARSLEMAFETTFDLSTLAQSFGNDDLWGEGTVTGTVEAGPDTATVDAGFRAEIVGYADWSAPYQAPLVASATIAYRRAAGAGTIRNAVASLGEGTELTIGELAFVADPFSIQGELEFASVLAVLVDARLLDRADAALNLRADLDYRESGFHGDWNLKAQLDELTLRDNAAKLTDWTAHAEGNLDGGITGQGDLRGAALSFAGATIHDIAGSPALADDLLTIASATATSMGGEIVADLRVEPFDERMPVELSAELGNIDLARLTQEVQPPAVELTGLAAGTLDLVYDLDGLEAFSLYAFSDERLTLNRDLVEKLLRSDAFASVLGARRLERTLTKLLGDAPQRPFDTGEMNLSLEDDRFIGETRLKSEKTPDYNGLNLNVELAIDIPALSESLKLLEQADTGDLDL